MIYTKRLTLWLVTVQTIKSPHSTLGKYKGVQKFGQHLNKSTQIEMTGKLKVQFTQANRS